MQLLSSLIHLPAFHEFRRAAARNGSQCAELGSINFKLKLMDCDDSATRMKWCRTGQIQSVVVQDRHSYWEVCNTNPGFSSSCIDLQNPIEDNGEQLFVISGTDLILKVGGRLSYASLNTGTCCWRSATVYLE